METVRIYRQTGLRPRVQARLRAAQKEAAAVWTHCWDLHCSARQQHARWRTHDAFHRATQGRIALQSQTVQAILRTFLGNVDTTRALRQTNPRIRYPYTDKRYYPLLWPPAQAMSRGRVVLPVDLPEQRGTCKVVWRDGGYKLHVSVSAARAEAAAGPARSRRPDMGHQQLPGWLAATGIVLVSRNLNQLAGPGPLRRLATVPTLPRSSSPFGD